MKMDISGPLDETDAGNNSKVGVHSYECSRPIN